MGHAPVDPVGDVEGAVDTQCSEVVGRDCFRVSCPLKHEELGEDGYGLEEDGE